MDRAKALRVLRVKEGASSDIIKAAYLAAAKKHHPDKGGDVLKMQEVSAAYELLKNPPIAEEVTEPPQTHGGFLSWVTHPTRRLVVLYGGGGLLVLYFIITSFFFISPRPDNGTSAIPDSDQVDPAKVEQFTRSSQAYQSCVDQLQTINVLLTNTNQQLASAYAINDQQKVSRLTGEQTVTIKQYEEQKKYCADLKIQYDADLGALSR